MSIQCLQPTLPFYDDEITQAYLARIGQFQTGASIGFFCRFLELARSDLREGNERFIEAVAAVSGVDPTRLRHNAIEVAPNDTLLLRGETLSVEVVRRVTVKFCPQCLLADAESSLWQDQGAWRFRWSWLLKPVVACPVHGTALMALPAKEPVRAFDLQKLLAENHINLVTLPAPDPLEAGSLQTYVVDRMNGVAQPCQWLDGQGIGQLVKTCERLGSLISEGPLAEIHSYSEIDWARVGNLGFDICLQGPDAILDTLGQIKRGAGRTSGRSGPQAVYGHLFNWLQYTEKADDYGPIRNILHDALVENFAIGPGEVLLGKPVERRKVHSVNSLVNSSGLTRFRLYRVLRKAGLIPNDIVGTALNQLVFPAEEAEIMIARLENSVPQNRIKDILGSTKTQAEQLALHGLISSVVPIPEDQHVGLTRGDFNRDDLLQFLDQACGRAEVTHAECDGFADLTHAARPISSAREILGWQLDGKLKQTRLLNGVKRLDHLRFCRSEVREMVAQKRCDVFHRLTAVALILGIRLDAVKRLLSDEHGGPYLIEANTASVQGLAGTAYVTGTELDRFSAKFMTAALIGRFLEMNHLKAKALIEQQGVDPVFDPKWLGASVYPRDPVMKIARDFLAHVRDAEYTKSALENDAGLAPKRAESGKITDLGESDATLL